jgi:hypothetical protein
VKPDPQPAPGGGQLVDWFGRKVLVVPNGSGRGRHSGRPRRFTPAVIAKLRRQAATTPVRELAHHYGVSRQRNYTLIGPKSSNPREPGTPGGRYSAMEDKLVRSCPLLRLSPVPGDPGAR